MSKYDDMPIGQIQDVKELADQVAKRLAKETVRELKIQCEIYCVDYEYCLETLKRKMNEVEK